MWNVIENNNVKANKTKATTNKQKNRRLIQRKQVNPRMLKLIQTMLQKSIAFFSLNIYKINKEKKENHLFQSWTIFYFTQSVKLKKIN